MISLRKRYAHPHGRFKGLRSETTLMILPSTEMPSFPATFTSASKVPSMESYFRRWDACLTPPVSLITTTSKGESFLPCQQRMKFLPIRPKPLIATLIFASTIAFFCPEFAACQTQEKAQIPTEMYSCTPKLESPFVISLKKSDELKVKYIGIVAPTTAV